MNLKKIANVLNTKMIINSKENCDIKDVSYNSRTTKPGDIFVCLIGEHTDGHDYVKTAVDNGAVAVIAQKEVDSDVPVVLVDDTKLALSQVSNVLNDYPSQKLNLIGVTGTNGKTTVTHLIENIFEKSGQKCGLIGTMGLRKSVNDTYHNAKHTTPQSPELQKTLKSMLDDGIKNVVMEVSSHSLEQHRVGGCVFNGAVFTNLTQDHLDYHITMSNYAKAKAKLFKSLKNNKDNRFAVVNADDEYAYEMLKAIPDDVEIYTYGIEKEADVMASDIVYSVDGVQFQCVTPAGSGIMKLQLVGKFSVYNALAALSAGLLAGIDFDTCKIALENTKSVAGRFEVVSSKPLVIVDYAHTPDGLENVLKAAGQLRGEKSELICLFGCGGDRDATKRPIMAHIAEKMADKVIITSDNPRSEDPQQIITDVLSGIQSLDQERIFVEIDRKSAIELAIKMASKEDIVVLAGKGHENYQILKDETIHFDDREEAISALQNLKS